VLDESRSFFRVHTGYFSNIPKCIKAEFIASWACSQSSVVSSSQRPVDEREINDTASFIKWCNYPPKMKQKRVGHPKFEGFKHVSQLHPDEDETDLVSLIRTTYEKKSID
ncbi:hypothetical protein TNCV_3514421, partial [Trichonephila clavipes]